MYFKVKVGSNVWLLHLNELDRKLRNRIPTEEEACFINSVCFKKFKVKLLK